MSYVVGDYRVIAGLGRGGMAEVYLAVRAGPVGFTKLIVIKRLRADLAAQKEAPRYHALLLDEANLTARLQHPNIVQTFEVGNADGRPFIAMEFLDGQPVYHVLRAARRAEQPVPVDLSLRVIADLLDALHYAHELRDYDGTPLRIVHRDVSPHNVFWTYDGDVKLVDFGIAKFALGQHETAAGVVKGKVTYMAPEQARGEPIDRRADVFAVGVMLWEMVVGRRLFDGNSQTATLHALLFSPIPSLADARPGIDARLAEICARSLEREPDDRYQDAAAMRADLDEVCGGHLPRREQLAAFVQPLFETDRREAAEQIRDALQGSRELQFGNGLPDAIGRTIVTSGAEDSAPEDEVSVRPQSTAATVMERRASARSQETAAAPARGQRGVIAGLLVAIAATLVTIAVLVVQRLHGDDDRAVAGATPQPSRERTVAVPRTTDLRLCGSGTLGMDLAPALVEAFLRKKSGGAVARVGPHDQLALVARLADREMRIDVAATGTASAFEGLERGTCDIGMASRTVDYREVSRLDSALHADLRAPATEHVIALDSIAIVVHANNPVRELDRDTLRDVFTGAITDWSEIGGAHGRIVVYARDESGTYDTFKQLVLDGKPLAASAKRFADSSQLADAVAADPAAIGFAGVEYVRSARALAIGDRGVAARLPTPFTVATEAYLLSRRLYFYTPPSPRTPLVTDLVSFASSRDGQAVVRAAGFVDLAIAIRDAEPCDARCPPRYAKLVEHARRVSVDFRFRSGLEQLDSRATRDLDRLVALLRDHSDRRVLVIGFASKREDRDAVLVSRDGAELVARELAARGVTAAAVEAFGDAMPVVSEARDPDRTRNRRVEVWLR